MSIVSPPDRAHRVPEDVVRKMAEAICRPMGHSTHEPGHWRGDCYQMSVYALVAVGDWLEEQAEQEATGSRDFGRGYMHAVRLLRGE